MKSAATVAAAIAAAGSVGSAAAVVSIAAAFVSNAGVPGGRGGRPRASPRPVVASAPFISTSSSPLSSSWSESNGGGEGSFATATTPPLLEGILDDGQGHINSELARAIYEWETAHRDQWPTTTAGSGATREDSVVAGAGGEKDERYSDHDRVTFSTRDGLRLVDEMAREVMSSLGQSSSSASSSSAAPSDDGAAASYSDLVQDGIVALMRSMATYGDPDHLHSSSAAVGSGERGPSFERHARTFIRGAMVRTLAHSSRSIRLPRAAQDALAKADAAAVSLRESYGREPALSEVARAAGIDPERLHLYRSVGRGTLSMESTVEVRDPSVAAGSSAPGRRGGGVAFADEAEGAGPGTAPDDPLLASPFGAPSTMPPSTLPKDDWIVEPPEREVSPLRDALVDDDDLFNRPDQRAYRETVRDDLDDFLARTLTDREALVVRLRFGLLDSKSGGRGWTHNEVGRRLDLSHDEVVQVADDALEKLRKARMEDEENRLAYLDEQDPQYAEVSL